MDNANPLQRLQLLIFDDQVFHFDRGQFRSEEAHVLYMIHLKNHFARVRCLARVSYGSSSGVYTIPPDIPIHPLPYYKSVPELCWRLLIHPRMFTMALKASLKAADVLMLSWPHPLTLLLLVLRRALKPNPIVILLVRQNMRELVKARYKGVKRLLAQMFIGMLEWQLFRHGRDAVIFTVSSEVKHQYEHRFPFVYTIRLPVVSAALINQMRRQRALVHQSEKKILYVGRLEPEKGLGVLISVFHDIAMKFPVRLEIVGSGAEAKNLQEMVRAMKIEDRVSFSGYIPFGESLLLKYLSADVFVLPSVSEGFPNVLIEAMACGLAVVATRVGGCVEIIRHRENGILVEPQSPSSLYEALYELLDNQAFRDHLGQKARIDASRYALEEEQTLLCSILESMCKKVPYQNIGVSSSDPSCLTAEVPSARMELPFVSVIMPVRNEVRFVRASLDAILAQDYPREKMEIIVADGMSDDGTREILEQYQMLASHVKVIDNPEKIVSTALNRCLSVSHGEVIVRVDGHCVIASDYLRKCVAHLVQREVAAVGGSIETLGETWLGRVIAVAMSSPFGVGNSAFRTTAGKTAFVDTVPFPAFTREALSRAGPFDTDMVCNEDDEFNYRLRKLGFKILLASDIQSKYYCRSSLRGLWTQYYRYGYYKVAVLFKHPRQMKPRQFVPALMLLTITIAGVGSFFSSAFSVVLYGLTGAYLGTTIAGSLLTMSRARFSMLPLLPLTYATIHMGYGLGFLVGLVKTRGIRKR